MESGFLLDVIVGKSAAVLELLARKDQTLLVRGNALLILDLALHHVDGVAGFHLKGDGLARQCLDEDLHATAQAEHQVERGFLLDVVVGKRAAVLELLARKDKALLVRRDALLVLDLALHHVDGVAGFYLEGDGLAGERLDEDLHPDRRAHVATGWSLDLLRLRATAVVIFIDLVIFVR